MLDDCEFSVTIFAKILPFLARFWGNFHFRKVQILSI